ncbi:hypothetical protein BO70DRAFT_433533 [Aspergillus heteromorphus CBS 117.55]|uniref:DRBM domain-containing protein n=1 Tax=Aspergillus heteromorphus CBS 117.55 TaxID=1448321 RepID=A0A317URX6_9EURO|nr:uncharacterized protein BO70DRAFT_433533 [Aspergillus heteromorphus CBS 117.55]PWY64773.1 hypothetical protein BO70DRAFT_433533 [Aspergillus heteromorphus CBS 117.55]
MAAAYSPQASKWQDKLNEYCTQAKIAPPVYNFFTDRRGGRTAWSTSVTIQSPTSLYPLKFNARYFYDGTNNAQEDAAEVALGKLPPLRQA